MFSKTNIPSLSVVILGPPGSGKGTQARCLSRLFGFSHIDIGSLLREMARSETDLGRRIGEVIHEENTLVPDGVVTEALEEKMKAFAGEGGVALDGAPRRVEQIEPIEAVLAGAGFPVFRAISIVVSEESIVERIGKRYLCPRCHNFYVDGVDVEDARKDRCPQCRYPLEKREDDTPEGVRRRLHVFREETLPVIEAYRERGILIEADGEQEIDLVCEDVSSELMRSIREKQ